jgi:hypothetical protein
MKKYSALILITLYSLIAFGQPRKGKDRFKLYNFELDDSKSIFKYAKNTGEGFYWYSIGGVKKDIYDKDPFFAVLISPVWGPLLECANEAASSVKNQVIKNQIEGTTNGLPSLKREVYGELNGKPSLMFQHLVIVDDKLITMEGIADESNEGMADDNYKSCIVEFEKLSSTLKRK